uniref:CAB/ELIP/HLIP superfamily protein n=1 Tax=Lithothamnion sp. TaxID=1940749 RepID=A0A3G3MG15_9FLOR|nr:CAB/ELIP/HLIP superfamily protein [Lithothamnion sp.]
MKVCAINGYGVLPVERKIGTVDLLCYLFCLFFLFELVTSQPITLFVDFLHL